LKVQFNNSTLSNQLWNVSSSQGANWTYATVNIGKAIGMILSGWRINFEALPNTSGTTAFSDDVAIDDIAFTNCNPVDYLRSSKCDFEADFCGWTNVTDNTKFNWTRQKG
jgi:hypothetical protein